jgi:hypothetical protein
LPKRKIPGEVFRLASGKKVLSTFDEHAIGEGLALPNVVQGDVAAELVGTIQIENFADFYSPDVAGHRRPIVLKPPAPPLDHSHQEREESH